MADSSTATLVNTPSIEYLSPSIHLHNASHSCHDSASVSTPPAPNLILLFSWTGAQARHVAKYISGYKVIFPSTPVMVITTSINDLICRTSGQRRRALLPAITKIFHTPRFNSKILVHAFSEGGSATLAHFGKAFLTQTRYKLPISGLVLDSCPGTLSLHRLARTARNTVPNNPTAQVVTSLFAYTVIASYWTTFFLIGDREDVDDPKDLYAKTKRALDDPALWDTCVPRAYLFSRADRVVDWKSIRDHARAAEGRGTPVSVTLFDDSQHCAHIRREEDAERYWGAVGRVWDARWGSGREVRRKEEVGGGEKGGVLVTVWELPAENVKKRCTCLDCGALKIL